MESRTKKQHVLPRRSLERFCGSGNTLFVKRHDDRIFPANPNNDIFISLLKWGEDAESGIKQIEAKFQVLAERIIANHKALEPSDYVTLNQFLALISERSRARYLKFDDRNSLFDPETVNYSNKSELVQANDERERIFFSRGPRDKVLERAAISCAILQQVHHEAESNAEWGVLTTHDRFVVSDTYHEFPMIPLSPTIYLVRDYPDELVSEYDTALINDCITRCSRDYVFSDDRDLLERRPSPGIYYHS